MKNTISKILSVLILSLIVSACKNSSFLDHPPTMREVVPTTADDYERLLRHPILYESIIPGFGEASVDDYYVIDFVSEIFNDLKNIYLWRDGIYDNIQRTQWARPYQVVFFANNVLEGLSRLKEDSNRHGKLRGEALFHRAHQFYHLAQIFAPHYREETAATDLAIPLRLTADINESITRSTVQQTYNQIILDLDEACQLLPQGIESRTIPSKEAAHALLSRVYWTIGEFEKAKHHADTSLFFYDFLLDYNHSNANLTNPFIQYNEEVIYHSTVTSATNILYLPHYTRVSADLYNSYDTDDLRRELFYQLESDGVSYRGSYDGSWSLFFGLAVDELYLIRSESAFRTGDRQMAEADLNHLLSYRYKLGSSKPALASMDNDTLLDFILAERRRELAFRGLRWIDLRRLNAMGHDITLTREHEGELLTLAPGDPRWTFPLPPQVLSFNPDMDQNPE